MIPVQEVLELLTKIHDILDNAVPKQVLNTACILASLFNIASRQHHEVWASQYPFLHNSKDSIPPSEACFYGNINWSLAQTQQQSSLGLSQSATSLRGGRARLKVGSQLSVQKRPVKDSSGGSMAKKPHSNPDTDSHLCGRKSSGGGASPSVDDSKKKGSHGGQHS